MEFPKFSVSPEWKHRLTLGALALVVLVGTYLVITKSRSGGAVDSELIDVNEKGGGLGSLLSRFGKPGTGGTVQTPGTTGTDGTGGGGGLPTGTGGNNYGDISDYYTPSNEPGETYVANYIAPVAEPTYTAKSTNPFVGLVQTIADALPGNFQGGIGQYQDGTGQLYAYDYVSTTPETASGYDLYGGWRGSYLEQGAGLPTDIISYSVAPFEHTGNTGTAFYADANGNATNHLAAVPDLQPGQTLSYIGGALGGPGTILPYQGIEAPNGYTAFTWGNEVVVAPTYVEPNANNFTGMTNGNQVGNGNGSGDPNNTN